MLPLQTENDSDPAFQFFDCALRQAPDLFIDRSTAANDPRPSASCSALKNPQRIPVNTPPVFPRLRPRIWPHLIRLVTKAMSR